MSETVLTRKIMLSVVGDDKEKTECIHTFATSSM